MNTIFTESLDYQLYLAEQELHDKLSVLSIKYNGIITEQNYQLVTEDVKETIMTYVRKVIANIQKFWDNIKSSVNDEKYKLLMNKYGKYIDANFTLNINDENYLIPDFKELDEFLKLVLPTDFNSLLNDLEDTDTFIKNKFNFLYDEKEKNLSKVAESKLFKPVGKEFKIVGKAINEYNDFLKNYKGKVDSLSNDIKKINESTRNIERIVSSNSIGTLESFDLSKTLSYYFTEADEEERKDNSSEDKKDPTFSSGSENNSNDSDKKKNDELSKLSKKVNLYFKVCTSVLSTKMGMLNKTEKICFQIVKNFCTLAAKESGDNKPEEKKDESSSDNKDNGTPQVNNV